MPLSAGTSPPTAAARSASLASMTALRSSLYAVRTDLRGVYAHCQIYFHPSDVQGGGNDLLEFTPSASVSIQGTVSGGGGTNTLENFDPLTGQMIGSTAELVAATGNTSGKTKVAPNPMPGA